MERWFVVRGDKYCFGFASENGIIVWCPEYMDWMGKDLVREIKPILLSDNARVVELKKDL